MKKISDNLLAVSSVRFIEWEKFKDANIFITGATGLVGYAITETLVYINALYDLNIHITALVRDKKRAYDRFKDINCNNIVFVEGTVEEFPAIVDEIDYIIHGASKTASREFIEHPVETLDTAVFGTKNLLKLAVEKRIKSFVYLSSMEVYGAPQKGHLVTENETGCFTPINLRNSYPIGKITCEAMCCAYAREYDVPVKVIRLTQTIGAEVNYDDNRIFAYFGRCVKEKKNIVLKTTGESERSYINVIDAVTAVCLVLIKGENGEIYNAADEGTYCSISEMAERVAKKNGLKVEYDIQPAFSNGYPDAAYMNLDTTKLRNLGWSPIVN